MDQRRPNLHVRWARTRNRRPERLSADKIAQEMEKMTIVLSTQHNREKDSNIQRKSHIEANRMCGLSTQHVVAS